MDLHHLRCFVILSKELNFRRAAEQLYMSQPSLTRLIAQMENELGVKLVYRTTRRVKLTTAGEVFLVEAQAVLQRAEQAICAVRQAAVQESGRLGLAFTEIALHSVVPKVLSVFRDRFPNVRLDILEACTEEQVEALRIAKVDVGFLHPPLRADFLALLPVFQERLMVALPIDRSLTLQGAIAFDELVNETFVLHPRDDGPVLYDQIVTLCEQAGFSPKIFHKADEQTFMGLTAAKVGISFMPPSMQHVKNPGVTFVPLKGDAPLLELALAWRQDNFSPFVEAFICVVQEMLQLTSAKT
jgi:DNA-binding transcriptional LysR family regulator